MTDENLIPIMDVDFAIPAQTFKIEYSLIARKSPPLVREFMLRLLNVSSFRIEEIAQFFGFSKQEAEVAVSDLLDRGDAEFQPDGVVALTDQAKKYFDFQGDSPQIAVNLEARDPFSFDLLAFSYAGKRLQRDGWKAAIEVNVPAESRANSQDLARQAFQRNFLRIYEKGHIGRGREEKAPDLYKISDVKREREGHVRIERTFRIDPMTSQIDRGQGSSEFDEAPYIEAVAAIIDRNRHADNTRQVAECAQAIGDDYTLSILGSSGLDVKEAIIRVITDRPDARSPTGRLFGSIHLNSNWDRVRSLINRSRERISLGAQSAPLQLTWMVPNSPYWARSMRSFAALSDFQMAASGVGKRSDQKIIAPRLYLPLEGADDDRGISRLHGRFGDLSDVLHGYVAGAPSSCFEAIVLPGNFAVVVYHLSQDKLGDIPIPFGFITEDQAVIGKVVSFVGGFLGSYVHGTATRDIGALAEHRAWAKKGKRV